MFPRLIVPPDICAWRFRRNGSINFNRWVYLYPGRFGTWDKRNVEACCVWALCITIHYPEIEEFGEVLGRIAEAVG
jgi:hypothetical protein